MINAEEGGNEEEGNIADGMRLFQLLIACAEAVACRDKTDRQAFSGSTPRGGRFCCTHDEHNGHCFRQEGRREALRLVYEICPHIRFGHFVANNAILEAFEGESPVHVVDLGMTLGLTHGHQWRLLIQSLAEHAGKPPRVLSGEEQLGKLDLKTSTSEGEALVVNSILQLHCVVTERRGALNSVLQIIHELSQKVLVLAEQDSSHNGPFFLERFMEALHYYSTIFGSLDAMLPKYDTRRAKMEQFYFAEELNGMRGWTSSAGGRAVQDFRLPQLR
ncbi:hypothetical protein OIU79_029546 [Salix purpurea]|uniref:DELLA protein n=1 Tax=Salix purpurea TaxID=77065 RepID=A0A9Q0VH17_SALPP|nr:hypothetical protein OIU79_029546 [Salix purpurea]